MCDFWFRWCSIWICFNCCQIVIWVVETYTGSFLCSVSESSRDLLGNFMPLCPIGKWTQIVGVFSSLAKFCSSLGTFLQIFYSIDLHVLTIPWHRLISQFNLIVQLAEWTRFFFYQNDIHMFTNNIYNIKTIKIKET